MFFIVGFLLLIVFSLSHLTCCWSRLLNKRNHCVSLGEKLEHQSWELMIQLMWES